MYSLKEIAEWSGGKFFGVYGAHDLVQFDHKQADLNIHGGSIDTRTLQQGNIFFALKGEHVDGHDFIEKAFEKGASVAVVLREWFENLKQKNSREHGDQTSAFGAYLVVDDVTVALQKIATEYRNKFNILVIGISGCNGKTTTKNLLASVLKKHFGDDDVLYTQGNNNNHIGVPLTLLSLVPQHKVVVVELGSNHPGEIAMLCEIAKPTHGITTNIGAAHIEFFGTLEAIADEEGSLAGYLPADGVYVLPKEDVFSAYIATKAKSHIEFVHAPDEETIKKLSNIDIKAHHIVLDACMVMALARCLGVSEEKILDGLTSAQNDEGRFTPKEIEIKKSEQVDEIVRCTVIDDTYNGNPDSVIAAMKAAKELYSGASKILALGILKELGDYAHTGYVRILHAASELNFSEIILVGIDENFEDTIAKFDGLKLTKIADNKECVQYLKSITQSGNVILCKGSHGARMWEVVKGLSL